MDKSLIFKKDNEIIYVKTKAENVFIDDTNIRDKIDRIDSEIDELKRNTGDNSSGGVVGEDIIHRESTIKNEHGVHGLRYYENKLSIKNDLGEWQNIQVEGKTDFKLPPTKFIEILSREANVREVNIKWEDADNQIINGAIVSTWGGTKLIRKQGTPPVNEYDGQLLVDNKIKDNYKLTGYTDSGIELDTIYYYALFPYTIDGTYNYDISNIVKFLKTANATPENTTNIVLTPTKNAIKLKWTDAQSSPTALWSGTKIVRKIGAPPTSESDGVLVLDNSTRDRYKNNYFTDSGANEKHKYYYGFFPYSSEGHYNTSLENVKSSIPVTGKIYSITVNMDDSSPYNACTYGDDAVGITANTGWDNIDIFNPQICTFKNGIVNYYLNENKYSEKKDNTDSIGNLNGIDGDVMSEIKFIGIKVEDININTIKVSITGDKQVAYSDLGFDCSPFIDKDGNVASKIYVGVYESYIDSGNIYSKTGVVPQGYSIDTIVNACKSKGEYYSAYHNSINNLLYFMYLMKYKTRSFSQFLVSGTTFQGETGTCNNNGLWHKGNVGKLLGIEWGASNKMLYLDGISYRQTQTAESSGSGTRIATRRYIKTTKPLTTSILSNEFLLYTYYNSGSGDVCNHNGYTSKMKNYGSDGNIILLPQSNGNAGASNTHFCCQTMVAPGNSGVYGAETGCYCINVNNSPQKSILNIHQIPDSEKSQNKFTSYLIYTKGDEE